jgi:hypothetical protein
MGHEPPPKADATALPLISAALSLDRGDGLGHMQLCPDGANLA